MLEDSYIALRYSFFGDYSNALTHHSSTAVSVFDSTDDSGKFQSFMLRTFVFP
jgi:hypothetical protein